MIFRPEHAEDNQDISYVYLVNQIFETLCDLLVKWAFPEIRCTPP